MSLFQGNKMDNDTTNFTAKLHSFLVYFQHLWRDKTSFSSLSQVNHIQKKNLQDINNNKGCWGPCVKKKHFLNMNMNVLRFAIPAPSAKRRSSSRKPLILPLLIILLTLLLLIVQGSHRGLNQVNFIHLLLSQGRQHEHDTIGPMINNPFIVGDIIWKKKLHLKNDVLVTKTVLT